MHIMGLPHLGAKDAYKVFVGNTLVRFSSSVLGACRRMSIPCVMENPHSSRIWRAPAMQIHIRNSRQVTLDFCQYGTPWRKRTRLLGYHICLSRLGGLCTGKGGMCSA